jgi:membrane-associated phospholipid phosphatase
MSWYMRRLPAGLSIRSVTFAALAALAFILARQWPRAARWISCIASALILLVGFSRVFLGAHWVTDVLAGYAAGAFIMLAGILALELLAYTPRAKRRP